MEKGIVVIDEDGMVHVINAVFCGKKEVFSLKERLCGLTYGYHLREPSGGGEWARVDKVLRNFSASPHPCVFGNGHRGEVTALKRHGTELFADLRAGGGAILTLPLTLVDLAPPPTAL